MRTYRNILVLLLAPMLVALTACTGGGTQELSPAQSLAAAKKRLDRTSGVHIALSTENLPNGVDGIVRADGVGTHAPAFDGDLKVAAGGIDVDAGVVAVDNVVYAKLPFTTHFVRVDPADYGAPDPADLMDNRHGLSSLLTGVRHLEPGHRVRHGKQVLTQYTGRVPGDLVASIIPSASAGGDFGATFTIDEDHRLREAVLTGPFYPNTRDVTYTIEFDRYGTSKHVTAP
jgi:lipoprotein LprG